MGHELTAGCTTAFVMMAICLFAFSPAIAQGPHPPPGQDQWDSCAEESVYERGGTLVVDDDDDDGEDHDDGDDAEDDDGEQ